MCAPPISSGTGGPGRAWVLDGSFFCSEKELPRAGTLAQPRVSASRSNDSTFAKCFAQLGTAG